MIGIFFAGHETSANALTFSLWNVVHRPHILRKLRSEIDSVLGTQEPTIPLINQMPYLDGVVKESMRLNPVVSAMGRVSTKAFKYNGLEFPKGTEFMVDIIGHHLNPEYFEDPEKFWPERWENANDWLKPWTYLPFSDGPHKYVSTAP